MTETNPTLPPNVPASARCLLCGTPTQSLRPDEGPMDGATAWYSSGNYGSQVHDTCGHPEEPRLEIHICDVCLLLHRNRVLQFDPRQRGHDRVYTTWEAPKAGLDMKRRVVLVWETEDGNFTSARHEDGSGSYHGMSVALEQAVDRVLRSNAWLEARSSVATCREELRKSIRESDLEMPEVVVTRSTQLLDAIGERFPQARVWARADDVGLVDHTGEEAIAVHEPVVRFETRVVPGVLAEVSLGARTTFVRVGEQDPITFEGFDVDRVLSLIAPRGKTRA